MIRAAALLFDFDGVLLESEYAGNRIIADYLTGIGHPTTPEQSMRNFMGLAGADFHAAVERWIGRTPPDTFATTLQTHADRLIEEGIEAVAGAVAFVRALPADLPRAICSSSSSKWIRAHLDHIGLDDAFGDHIYSGREHVARGKPAPDLYLHAARELGMPIKNCAIIEDSAVGATGALASGAAVIGLIAGRHCDEEHAEALRTLGVKHIARDFGEVARLLA